MEKRKTNLTVEDFEDKKYGAGKRYTRFKTDQGWISSFDKKVIEKMKDSVDKCVSVEITTDDDDREKITKFYGPAKENSEDEVDDEKPEVIRPGERKSVKGSAYEKDPVGLAVEVFCSLYGKEDLTPTKLMTYAADLVKQAQEEFN